MTFRDMAFCAGSKDCGNTGCYRHFGEDDHEAAVRWWGSDQYPVAYSPYYVACASRVAK